MKLVIAEKPSVAMALASVLGARTRKDGYVEGNGYIVSWCVGHLVGLCDASEYDEKYKKWRYEDLPIVPECWKHKILEGTKKQFGILKKLMRDSKVDEVICATDAGREGELIFRLVYEQAGCKKPMKRLWISSMEEQAIKDGFASLKDGSCYDSLYQSALCRAKADWLVGINASRLFSVLYNQNLKVGRVEISKTDITGETEIPGAKLTILDKDDQVVESWTSTEEAHYIEKLPIGKYTLREEQAPKGYLLTADVTFEVKDTGEIQKVAMKDDTAKGKVILNKTDKSSGEPLKGVEFELRDSKGKVLETLKTDAAGHAESKLYEIATFKNGKYDTAIKYYLVETKTLDGYTLDQTKHEVTFAYANDSTPVVEVTFNLTNEKPEVPETPNTPDTPQSHEETKVSNAPKTGDSTNIWLPIMLLVISTGGMAGLYISRKRKTK